MESVQYNKCEEVITFNRFQILTEEDSTPSKTSSQEEMNPFEEDRLLFQQTLEPEHISPTDVIEFSEINSLNKFMLKDNKYINNNNFYMYKRNKDFCSGYFPDFITLHDPMYYQLSNSNNHNFYYLKIQNGKYLKYLSNKTSKYDNLYFDNIADAYRISKIYSNRSLISNNPKVSSKQKNSETEINKCRFDNNVQIPQVKTLCQQDSERGIHEVNHNNQCYNLYPPYNEILNQQDSERGIPRIYYNNQSYNIYPPNNSCNLQNPYPKGTVHKQNSERGISECENNSYSHEGTYDQQDSERGIPEAIHITHQQNSERGIHKSIQNISPQVKTVNQQNSERGIPEANLKNYSNNLYSPSNSNPQYMKTINSFGILGNNNRSNPKCVNAFNQIDFDKYDTYPPIIPVIHKKHTPHVEFLITVTG